MSSSDFTDFAALGRANNPKFALNLVDVVQHRRCYCVKSRLGDRDVYQANEAVDMPVADLLPCSRLHKVQGVLRGATNSMLALSKAVRISQFGAYMRKISFARIPCHTR